MRDLDGCRKRSTVVNPLMVAYGMTQERFVLAAARIGSDILYNNPLHWLSPRETAILHLMLGSLSYGHSFHYVVVISLCRV